MLRRGWTLKTRYMKKARHQRTHIVRFHSREMSRTGKSTQRGSQLSGCQGASERGTLGRKRFLYHLRFQWLGACKLINRRKVYLYYGSFQMKRLPKQQEVGVYIPTSQGNWWVKSAKDGRIWWGLFTIFWNVLMSKIKTPDWKPPKFGGWQMSLVKLSALVREGKFRKDLFRPLL